MRDQILLVDLDGHSATIAVTTVGTRPDISLTVNCTREDELATLQRDLLSDAGDPSLAGAAFAAPGPLLDGAIQLTHSDMCLERDSLQVRPWRSARASRERFPGAGPNHAAAARNRAGTDRRLRRARRRSGRVMFARRPPHRPLGQAQK